MIRPGEKDKASSITLHDAADARQLAGPVEVPGSTEYVPATIGEMAALGDKLWITLTFYGSGLIMVERTS